MRGEARTSAFEVDQRQEEGGGGRKEGGRAKTDRIDVRALVSEPDESSVVDGKLIPDGGEEFVGEESVDDGVSVRLGVGVLLCELVCGCGVEEGGDEG